MLPSAATLTQRIRDRWALLSPDGFGSMTSDQQDDICNGLLLAINTEWLAVLSGDMAITVNVSGTTASSCAAGGAAGTCAASGNGVVS